MQEVKSKPTAFTLFEATGDLARKKIFIALFDLWKKDHFASQFHIIAVAHSDYTIESFRLYVRGILSGLGDGHDMNQIELFIKH